MSKSVAILGRQPAFGVAELERLYGADKLSVLGNSGAALLAMAPGDITFSRLGGTVKLCELLAVLETADWKDIELALVSYCSAATEKMPDGKIHLGLSIYDQIVATQQLLATGLRLKKAVSARNGRTVRLVPNTQAELNSAQVLHNHLTGPTGLEIVLVRARNQTFIAKTMSIQDIQQYSLRDYGRPKRDARVGMLPPKLAQIMINLAASHQYRATLTVLDPFCGTGVVLQEALLMGCQAYGTDIEPRMIAYTRTNLEWLAHTYSLSADACRLSAGDATSTTWQPPIDVITSETYLGRPFTAPPSKELLAQTASECNVILQKFLHNIHSQITPGTNLCLAIPAWRSAPNEFRHLPLIDRLRDLGYNRVHLQHVRESDLMYYREGQVVARQLLLLTRQ